MRVVASSRWHILFLCLFLCLFLSLFPCLFPSLFPCVYLCRFRLFPDGGVVALKAVGAGGVENAGGIGAGGANVDVCGMVVGGGRWAVDGNGDAEGDADVGGT